jgi:hypothetical protein
VFLIETKVKSEKLQRLRCSIGYNGLFHVDPVGRRRIGDALER